MTALENVAGTVPLFPLCQALGVPRASLYRRRRPRPEPVSRAPSPRALTPPEQQEVRDVLHSEAFVDKAPAQVYASLLDEGRYLCSPRTMYRILAANSEVRERRNQLRHPVYTRPELLAEHPNQVWSWDIKLMGPVKWTYFQLYVVLDIFSRYEVCWMVAERESDALATRLLQETCEKQGILPGELTVHADRGSSMKSRVLALLLADLGVTKTHSRPHVSNDNPFSESQFKTLKYRPEFPDRFGCLEDARSFASSFFAWYNNEHYHSGIGFMNPAAVHYGQAPIILEHRRQVLEAAYAARPERFVRGTPRPQELPSAVWINPPEKTTPRLAQDQPTPRSTTQNTLPSRASASR